MLAMLCVEIWIETATFLAVSGLTEQIVPLKEET